MDKIISFLQLIDDEYIISLSNKGYLKRSKKNYPNTEIKLEKKNPLTLKVGEQTVIFNDAQTDTIKCDCSDSKFCRHRIMGIFYLKKNLSNETEEAELTEDNYKKLLEYDLDKLKKHFTSTLFKKGVKYFLKTSINYELTKRALVFTLNDKFSEVPIEVSFLSISPLENLICNNRACKGKKCIHQVGAFLHYLQKKDIIKESTLSEMIQKELTNIDNNELIEIENLVYEILNTGLSKITFLTTKRLRKLGIKLHYSIPAFEKLLYGIEKEIDLFLSKSGNFSISRFRDRTIKILRLIRIYRNNPTNYTLLNDLTKLRSEYQDAELTLLGVGREYIETEEMAMMKIYFISQNNQFFSRTLFLSLKQGSNYGVRSALKNQTIWEQPTEILINQSFTIKKTKINNEGVISSLGNIIINNKLLLKDRYLYTDYKKLKENYIDSRRKNSLLAVNYKPFFTLIKISEYGKIHFDFDTQDLKIELFDSNDNLLTLKIKYSDYPKNYIKERKQQFDNIISLFKNQKREKPTIIFGIPYIDENILYLKGISVYYEKSNKIFSIDLDGISNKKRK